jgi:ribonuclease HI
MKKFSISQLEVARRNANTFANALKNDAKGSSFGGRPKSVRWLDAIGVYHNSNDISSAINKLSQAFSRRKDTTNNRKELESLIQSLENYVHTHHKLNYIFLEKSHSVEIFLSNKVKITGWIWLLNMKPNGERAGYMISKDIKDTSWQNELRFPIIQDYIANKIYGCELNEVEVGVIDFKTGNHHTKKYSAGEIKRAITELDSIGTTITNILD